ncbi:arylamine N-acetyltransferase family protein [Streptomyces acidicola]|uniref:arylamine N-acetyltransferase family protein n=1 Tax=Streptomyces acidicola TaxID=2596892 RepID=UPI00341FDE72
MNSAQVDAYLRRIGAEYPAGPTPDALRELQPRHLRAVPFENLSVHLGEKIVLDEEPLLDKVVGARRGGFCYELNGAFAALLTALGFEVTLLAARVFGEAGRLGIPYDHLALLVRTGDGGEWLADVGFGAHSLFPLAFGERGEQEDPGGTFRVVAAAEREEAERGEAERGGGAVVFGDVDVLRDGKPVYRLEVRPRVVGDFVAGAWWHSTSPASHFTQSLVCSRVTEDDGRVTLSGRRLTVTSPDGGRSVTELETDEEVVGTYRARFGIELEWVPEVRKTDKGS